MPASVITALTFKSEYLPGRARSVRAANISSGLQACGYSDHLLISSSSGTTLSVPSVPRQNLSRIKCSAGAVIVPVKVKGRARDLLKKTLGGRPLPFCGKRPPQCHATLERNGRGTQK